MDYNDYQCEDFVADSFFRQWVKHPDEASDHYWNDFLSQYPGKAETIAEAADIVRKLTEAVSTLEVPTDAAEQDRVWLGVKDRVEASQPAPVGNDARSPRRAAWFWMAAAAAVALVLSLGWWRIQQERTATITPPAAAPATAWTTTTNTSNGTLLVSLPDGSSVVLHKQSSLRYPSQFARDRRVVYLEGEAFFEVEKDYSKPFFVHTNTLTTRVLGTSFTIRSYGKTEQATVAVRSGKVAVFRQSGRPEAAPEADAPGLERVVLTRNQQLVVHPQDSQLARPVTITPARAQKTFAVSSFNFTYEATPVSTVFDQLEKAYGVKVSYDRQRLGTCRLTADLADEPLPGKMLIICKSIEASFTLTNNQLTVTGPGCRP